MKKGLVRIIAGCLTVVMTAAAVMAAPSPTKNGTVSQEFTINARRQIRLSIKRNLRPSLRIWILRKRSLI